MPPIIFFSLLAFRRVSRAFELFVRAVMLASMILARLTTSKASIHLAASFGNASVCRPSHFPGAVRVTCEFVFPRPKSHFFTSKGN